MELRYIIFFAVISTILFSLQWLVYRTFNNFLKSNSLSRKTRFYLAAFPFLFFNIPLLLNFIFRGFISGLESFWQYLITYPFYIFQAAIVFIGLYLLVGKILKSPFTLFGWMFSKIKLTKDWLGKIRNDKAIVKFDNSRRKFITGASAIVSSYAFVGAGFGVLNKNDYKIEYVDIPVKNLSDEFVRTKFTFISDIHSGPYMDESLMNDYVEILNNLNSDYLFISGDLTNSMIEEAHPFSNAFKRLETNKGIYATLGNHDYFSDAEEVSKIISNETPIKIMRNESELLDINGDKLCLLGIDDTRDSGGSYNQAIIDYLDKAIIDAREKVGKAGLDYNKITKVLIYHKPYLFKDISEKNIDLTLSGHTHGGQVVLAKFGNLNISLAATVSEYISGLYRHGGNSLYVSRGLAPVGLPIRLNCPPEITVMRLVKQ